MLPNFLSCFRQEISRAYDYRLHGNTGRAGSAIFAREGAQLPYSTRIPQLDWNSWQGLLQGRRPFGTFRPILQGVLGHAEVSAARSAVLAHPSSRFNVIRGGPMLVHCARFALRSDSPFFVSLAPFVVKLLPLSGQTNEILCSTIRVSAQIVIGAAVGSRCVA